MARLLNDVEKDLASRGAALRNRRVREAASRFQGSGPVIFDGFFKLGDDELDLVLAVAQKIMPRCVHSKIDELPVVQPGALQMPIVNTKAQGLDQVERREGGRAKPGDATSIRGNLRLV